MPATVQLFLSEEYATTEIDSMVRIHAKDRGGKHTAPEIFQASTKRSLSTSPTATRRGVSYRSVPVPQHSPETTQRLSLSADTARESDTDTGRLHLKARQQAQADYLLAQLMAQLHTCNQEAEHCRNLESYTRSTVPGRDLRRSLER